MAGVEGEGPVVRLDKATIPPHVAPSTNLGEKRTYVMLATLAFLKV